MSWSKGANNHFIKPEREPDFIYKHDRYWFKEMISCKAGITAPIMECPVSGNVLVYRPPSGWYAVPVKEVKRQYEIWITDNILLGDADVPVLE